MGLALLIVVMKALGLRTGRRDVERRGALLDPHLRHQLRGRRRHRHPDGVPVRHQLGALLALRRRRHRPDARDGGPVRVLPRVELPRRCWSSGRSGCGRAATSLAAVALFVGQLALRLLHHRTNAFMQHPVGHAVGADGTLRLADFCAFLLNPWALAQYAHNMIGDAWSRRRSSSRRWARSTRSQGRHRGARAPLPQARRRRRARRRACSWRFPTGDHPGQARGAPPAGGARRDGGALRERAVAEHRPDRPAQRARAAARQPDRGARACCRFLAYGHFHSDVRGLDAFPETDWPDNIELLYYAFHVMVGLGTIFIGAHGAGRPCSRGAGRLETSRRLLWVLMLAFPFPYIANTAGWMTAELGRQPWLVYGLMRTADGREPDRARGHGALHADRLLRALPRARRAVPVPGRPRDRARGPDVREARRPMVEIWFAIAVVMLDGVRRARRLRLRRRRAAPVRRADRRRAAAGARRDRPVLGRQRGLAARRRRRAVRRASRGCSRPGSRASTSRSSSCSGA